MRPRSILGPVLLIVIGALFLLNNLRPDLRFVDLFLQFWPYLLIGWGALRLIEILVWFAGSRPILGPGVSGGEWALVILIAIAGSGMLFAHRHNWHGPPFGLHGVEVFGEAYDFSVPEQKVAAPGKTFSVVVENLRGNARITGGDVPEVKLSGRKSIRAMSQNEADQGNKNTPVEMMLQGGNVLIRTNQERLGGDRRISDDIEIAVPRGVTVECRGRYGDLDINDLTGDVEISSDNAGVRLQNIGGAVKVDTRNSDIVRAANVKGSVELRGKGKDLELEAIEGQVNISAAYWGDIQLRNLAKPLRWDSGGKNGSNQLEIAKLPGEVRMDLRTFTGNNLIGPVRLVANSLDAQVGDVTQSLEIELGRGDVELRPSKAPLSKMNVKTRSGNIEFAPPASAKFELKATTSRGEIENDFGPPLKMDGDSGSKHRKDAVLTGSVGQGPTITLVTDRGNVTVRKGTGEPSGALAMPPKPPAPPKGVAPLTIEKN
jgi:DUF4097 and DUF4098 domain-containing protein YvlB